MVEEPDLKLAVGKDTEARTAEELRALAETVNTVRFD